MSSLFKHLLHCTDCDESYYVLTVKEDQPNYCPMCGGTDVVDAASQAASNEDTEEGAEE